MAIRTENLRIESKNLINVINDISYKIYKINSGNVNFSFTKKLIQEIITGYKTVYELSISITSRFGGSEAVFMFQEDTIEKVYEVAVNTLQAWSKAYFGEIEIPAERLEILKWLFPA